MPRITIDVPLATSLALKELVSQLNEPSSTIPEKYNSHGELTVKKLLTMLTEDAAMVIERSGSWEASNMAAVLQSHGYRIQ